MGIGIIAGRPTGITIKTWTHPAGAIDFSVGWSNIDESEFTGQITFLRHTFNYFEVTSGRLPYYTGLGSRFLVVDPVGAPERTRIGIRGVAGLSYIFENYPAELFIEIGPVLDIVPATELDITGGFGARYYF